MTIESRKLQLIESIINENNEATLLKVERVIKWEKRNPSEKKTMFDFAAVLTQEEADAMFKAYECGDGCGHPDCLFKTLH